MSLTDRLWCLQFDCDGGKSSVVSHVDLKVGLRRLKIDHLFDLDALQWALEGGGMRDNACMYSEWMRNVAWDPFIGLGIIAELAAIDAANNQRRLIMRRVLTGVKERKEQGTSTHNPHHALLHRDADRGIAWGCRAGGAR